MRIDAHQHFWKYNAQEYGWISDAMSVLRRDYLPKDLFNEISVVKIGGVISVQARQSLEETNWLLDLADQNKFIKGVVGWVPLVSENISRDLEKYASRQRLKAVRHVLQDELDDNYMLRDDFNRGIRALRSTGLRYDILIYERHLPQAIQLVDRHPEQVFILDHVAKPRIRENQISPWRENMRLLAKRRNVYCKISGMVTEADHKTWTSQKLRPYLDTALEAFGSRRLMFGSDWPVCLLACGYRRWNQIITEFASQLTPEEQDRLFGATAIEAYGLTE
jgi:L-fuconolactonase